MIFSIDGSPHGLSSDVEVHKQFLISFNIEMLRSPDATITGIVSRILKAISQLEEVSSLNPSEKTKYLKRCSYLLRYVSQSILNSWESSGPFIA